MATTIEKYVWDFGDGTTGYEPNPTHTYPLPGRYRVTVTITDILGNTSTTTMFIRVWDSFGDNLRGNTTDKCWRYAVPQQKGQGVGFSEYDGDDWPNPLFVNGCAKVIDNDRVERQFAIDSNSYKEYELGYPDQWKDGGNDQYGGSDYEAEILFPEVVPPIGASAKLRHKQFHSYIRPWDKTVRNKDGYNADGFKPDFEMDSFLRISGQPVDAVESKQVPLDGQIVFDRFKEGNTLQPGLRLRGAPWRLPLVQMWYDQIDKSAAPPQKLMTEMTHQLEWSSPLVWISRDVRPNMERVSGTRAGGAWTTTSTGPDGVSGSGVVFTAAQSFTINGWGSLPGDFALSMWVKNPAFPCEIWRFATGGLVISLVNAGGVIQVQWNDGVNALAFNLNSNCVNWTMITLMRYGNDAIVYDNGVLINTFGIFPDPDIEYGGLVTMCAGALQAFDMRVMADRLSENAAEYGYNDITENNGQVICPIY